LSIVECRVCHGEWAATIRPCCPSCLLAAWLASPNLVTEKHHPDGASRIHEDYRSVVSEDLIANLRVVLADAVMSGTWYFNTEYEKFNHVTRMPLQRKPGSGLRAGQANPDRRLEDLVVADADQDPHVFADDSNETRRKIATGIYRPLEACSRAKCDNLSPPRQRYCAIHLDPPRAIRKQGDRHRGRGRQP
jgi:hypothetical protein